MTDDIDMNQGAAMTAMAGSMGASGIPVYLEGEADSWVPPSGAALWLSGGAEAWTVIVCDHASLNAPGITKAVLFRVLSEWNRGHPCDCVLEWLRFTETNLDAMLARLGHNRPNPYVGTPMEQAGNVMQALAAAIDDSPAVRSADCTCAGGPWLSMLLNYDTQGVKVELGHEDSCPVERNPDGSPADSRRVYVPPVDEKAN